MSREATEETAAPTRLARRQAHKSSAGLIAVRAAAGPYLVSFARQHAADLDRLAAGWAWMEVDARNAEIAAMPED